MFRRAARTPVAPDGLKKYDRLPVEEALVQAWATPGSHPGWHQARMDDVRRGMPLLARALDRLAAEQRGH